MKLFALLPAVESNQMSARHPTILWRIDGSGLFLHEHGRVRGEGPSGEERTPGRSRPLELCSTEDHDDHLQDEAAAT